MRVLVLCWGNVNRSAAVGAVMARELEPLSVISAGFMEGGRRATKKMREAMSSLGYSLDGHRSVKVDATAVEWADVVLIMDDRNERLFRAQFQHAHKLRRMGDFLDPPRRSIPDPAWLKKDSAEFALVVKMLVAAAKKAAAELREKERA